METIDLSAQEGKLDYNELGALDTSGKEVFESYAADSIRSDECTEYISIRKEQKKPDYIPSIGDTKRFLERKSLEGLVASSETSSRTLPKRNPIKESVEERLLRIKEELEEIGSCKETPLNAEGIGENDSMSNLHYKLTKLTEERIDELEDMLLEKPNFSRSSSEVILPRIKVDSSDLKRLLDLESKVYKLEKQVGLSENDDRSLMTKLNEIFRQINLLRDDNHLLDKFHRQLTQINSDYEESLLGRKAKVDPSLHKTSTHQMIKYESKIDELYKYHSLLQTYCPLFPKLTNRIRHINGMNTNVSECFELVKTVDFNISDLQEHAQKWEKIMLDMDKKLDSQEVTIENNMTHIEQELERLEQKIGLQKSAKISPSRE